MTEKISIREKLCYALGDASANIAWRGICTFLLVFYTDVVGLAPAVVATLMLVVRSFDGVTDVLMGIIGDNTKSKYGKFRPWVLWTAIPLAVILSLTFTCPPGVGTTGKIIYAYATYILFTLVYTANNIPYGALMAVMTGDDRERASIGSFRMAGAFAGGMVVQGSLLYLKDYFNSYSIPIYIMSVILAACLLVTFFGTKERVEPPKEQKTDLLADLKQLVTNVPWIVLLVVGLLFNVYNAVRQGITVIYFNHYLDQVKLCGAFLTAIMVASVFGALATGVLAKKFGKRNLFVFTLLAASAVNAGFAFCGPKDLVAIFVIGIVGEAIAAVFPTLFFTMLGDAADFSEYVHGRRATGLVYSAGSFATKFGGGVAGFIVGVVLAKYGYVGTDASTIPGAIPGIKLLMGYIPSVIAGITAFLMFLYPLSDRRLSEITSELSSRRK